MKTNLGIDEWKIIQRNWNPVDQKVNESIFSLGNGRMGLRGNFEEGYSGSSLQGSYFAGIYYPDKTKVGWWKNGYPEYFAKVLNATNWIALPMTWNGYPIDLHIHEPIQFEQVLDMRTGTLQRSYTMDFPDGTQLGFKFLRFCSMVRKELGAIKISVEVFKGQGRLEVRPMLDLDVQNEDSNYEEKFWERTQESGKLPYPFVIGRTKKTGFSLMSSMYVMHKLNEEDGSEAWDTHTTDNKVTMYQSVSLRAEDTYELVKYTIHLNSLYAKEDEFIDISRTLLDQVRNAGFEKLLNEHSAWWSKKWEESDIVIQGDTASQQGIRFNIFQLHQTYTGDDARLNIGPKGFTGEKYGGSTYWDTEAYCLPFFLSTAPAEVSKNLLLYRYRHLPKAIGNAENLGFTSGAALYPMVTMNGEECHNEWEITFEEIHRNGAIAYAIYDYIRYTGDKEYLASHGLEVLVAIARFWAQRVNWSSEKEKYVILGVTGPNEYENNVNNNWYTNYLARWCLQYTIQAMTEVKLSHPEIWARLERSLSWDENEKDNWNSIVKHLYLPKHPTKPIFLQQDGFLDKDIRPASTLEEKDRPLNQKWSWDRILRSCYIKQADVLQGLYFFEDDFSEDELRSNFDFYEPITVHESSLSPCLHAILASKLGKTDKAYEMYLRTSRLDLDDYNNDTEDGLHITSMAGTWMSVIKGFGGLRVYNGFLHINPSLPTVWKGLKFNILFRGTRLRVEVESSETRIFNHGNSSIDMYLSGKLISVPPSEVLTV